MTTPMPHPLPTDAVFLPAGITGLPVGAERSVQRCATCGQLLSPLDAAPDCPTCGGLLEIIHRAPVDEFDAPLSANAIKHSKADRIEISLATANGNILLTISDNGCGLPDNESGKSQGMGLLTMNHRARMIGGALVIEADRISGTQVRCTVPEIDFTVSP